MYTREQGTITPCVYELSSQKLSEQQIEVNHKKPIDDVVGRRRGRAERKSFENWVGLCSLLQGLSHTVSIWNSFQNPVAPFFFSFSTRFRLFVCVPAYWQFVFVTMGQQGTHTHTHVMKAIYKLCGVKNERTPCSRWPSPSFFF